MARAATAQMAQSGDKVVANRGAGVATRKSRRSRSAAHGWREVGSASRASFLVEYSETPDFRIQIALPAEQCKIDAAGLDRDPFIDQARALLAERAAAGLEREAAVGAQHAMPGQFRVRAGIGEHAPDQACMARQACARGNFAVAGDATARNRRDRAHDGLMLGLEAR